MNNNNQVNKPKTKNVPMIIAKVVLSLLIFFILEISLLLLCPSSKWVSFILILFVCAVGFIYGYEHGFIKKTLDKYIFGMKNGHKKFCYFYLPAWWFFITGIFAVCAFGYSELVGLFYATGHYAITGIAGLSGKK